MQPRGFATGFELVSTQVFADALGGEAAVAGEGIDQIGLGAAGPRQVEDVGQFAEPCGR